MRALIQRVERAQVEVEGSVVGSCGEGYLILLGVAPTDDEALTERLWRKVSALRICEDEEGRTNRSLVDTGGDVLVVSQFTLYADARRGNRPSFTGAARPELAERLYVRFCELAEAELGAERVGRGVFGAHMRVSLVNHGPFTVLLDTDELGWASSGV
ncbi:D-aminoacyl-tRNA deacylase [Olsenella sp. An290]|uniref:D-aminoacyl-tRNA deacylase n=1 Tax=Olsenella sp. An290 TaxID=1965625 RepID=UPI000B36CE14|nr:D-aminoacyl-tRNA deacylase [Olsenella sp. An290]OUO34386.1 D-tyrosyl-tRNA(Tyr) deacylase [Olsenella sp. An290]